MKSSLLIATLTAASLVASCASIVHGTTQKVGISSTPSGAIVTVDGAPSGSTPVFADLSRKSEHVVSIQLPGYETAQLTLTRSASGWVWGNIAFGGLIGLAIDAISGGFYTLSPEQLNAEMRKTTASADHRGDDLVVLIVLEPQKDWKQVGRLQVSAVQSDATIAP